MTDLDMDDKKLRSHIAAFEAALAARETTITEPPLGCILLALDGSNQDETALRLVIRLAHRTGATVLPLCAWETAGRSREEYLRQAAEALRRSGVKAGTVANGEDTRPPYQQILESCRTARCDLIVVPAPFRDDFAVLGHESVGTNLDVLLCRAPKSLLVIREPKVEPEKCLANILLPISPALAPSSDAAAWAIRLAEEGGILRILVVAGGEVFPQTNHPEGIRVPGPDLSPETSGIVAAVQRRAAEIGLRCRVEVRGGEEVGTIIEEGRTDDLLLVLPCCPRDPAGPTFQRVQAIIRLSANPVLMI